ncbi:hypothetical protein LEN26_000989 [Aphanomyces euteiches]|nr:hypothetical protein AeMF1_013539 [Aphanomyces euteiches]KAH9162317.1 hypothetical protein LEN26_000989 [Aphanomyces euteiches]KAH9190118.1 hypothetical protein AeNC1_007909 [Aphanomyces euteiches]
MMRRTLRGSQPPSILIKVQEESYYFKPCPEGISIGSDPTSDLRFVHDNKVERHHATLEHTPVCGVWVYVDHSVQGTFVNHRHHLQNEGIVVRDGDRFDIGNTVFFVQFQVPKVVPTAANAGPSTPRLTKKPSLAMMKPEYTNSPVPKHKRHVSAPTFNFDSTQENSEEVLAPSPRRIEKSPPPPPPSSTPPRVQTKAPISTRDDLRILVSKKMAHLVPKALPPGLTAMPMSPVPQAELRQQKELLQIQLAKKYKEDEWLHQQQREFLNRGSNTASRRSFTLDIQPPLSPATHEIEEVLSSVGSSAPTEIAFYRQSLDSLDSDDDDGDVEDIAVISPSSYRSLDVSHLRHSFDALLSRQPKQQSPSQPLQLQPSRWQPNPPPNHVDDDRINNVRLKRHAHLAKTTPLLLHPLHSPYKAAKHRAFLDSPVGKASPTHFDYTM